MLGHVHYVYADKYVADLAFSRNGSNLLAPSQRFGNFPAVSAAWIVSNENFLKDVAFLDLLKVRASWGLTGTDIMPEALMWNRKYGWAVNTMVPVDWEKVDCQRRICCMRKLLRQIWV